MIKRHNKNIFFFFFILYFVVYTASPIIITLPPQESPENIWPDAEASSSSDGFQILFIEEIGGKLVANRKAVLDGSTLKVLMKKKQAIPPDSAIEQVLHSDDTLCSEEEISLSPATSFAVVSSDNNDADTHDRHIPYRGHSPPLV